MAVKGKVVLVGDASVGKTSILRAGQNQDVVNIEPTVSASTVPVTVHSARGEVKHNFLDTAGQEVYRSFVSMFVRGSEVGLIVFDVTQSESIGNIEEWVALFDDLPPEQCQLVIVGNKSDLRVNTWSVRVDEVKTLCTIRRYPFFVTSAKTGDGITELFEELAAMVRGKAGDVTTPVEIPIEVQWVEEKRRTNNQSGSAC
jgi:small GTP-binding protein